jgi:hypothetical protein
MSRFLAIPIETGRFPNADYGYFLAKRLRHSAKTGVTFSDREGVPYPGVCDVRDPPLLRVPGCLRSAADLPLRARILDTDDGYTE